ncbi:MAG: peptidylprolyl isomerase [Bacteroidetes bacterium]|nr:peptidylprolyl isomerase [Bacteroidota bacterium]
MLAIASVMNFVACGGAKNKTVSKKEVVEEIPKDYFVQMTTNMGVMKLRLYNETPLHRDNFVKLVKKGFYDSLLFHRVIKQFMIQGGDPLSKNAKPNEMLGNGDVGYTIPAEISSDRIHKKGCLAAARDNNPEKSSSGCQFYIVQGRTYDDNQIDAFQKRNGWIYTPAQREAYKTVGGTPHLDNGYTVFGEVVEGLEFVDLIATMQTGPNDRPLQPARILTCKLVKN